MCLHFLPSVRLVKSVGRGAGVAGRCLSCIANPEAKNNRRPQRPAEKKAIIWPAFCGIVQNCGFLSGDFRAGEVPAPVNGGGSGARCGLYRFFAVRAESVLAGG